MTHPNAATEALSRGRIQAVVASLALSAAGYAVFDSQHQAWPQAARLVLVRDTGVAAVVALLLTLCATGVSRVLSYAPIGARLRLPTLRRALGISTASLATLHATVAYVGLLRGAWSLLWQWSLLRAGLGALCVLLALLLTSFPAVVRALHLRTWKELHRMVYAAALLTLLHVLLSPFGSRLTLLALFTLALAVGTLRAWPARSQNR